METWVHMFLLCAILVVLLRAVFLHRQRDDGKKKKKKKRSIPPGPPWVPLLGSVVWLTNSAADAEPLLQRLLRRYGPVVSLRVGSRLSVFVADRRLAHAALVEHGASLADRPSVLVAAATLLGENDNTITRASQGPVWRLLRRNLVAQTLHPTTRLRLLAPARSWVRRVLADKLRAGAEDPGGVVVMDTFRHAMFCLLALMCFGERLDEAAVRAIAAAQREQLLYFSRDMSVFAFFPSLTRHLFRGRLHRARALRRRQEELFLPLIDARRRRNDDDALEHAYVDTLLDIKLPAAEEHRPLSDQEMINLCSEFLNAGTDTTSTAMLWIMAELVKNPSIQDKLYNEISTQLRHHQEDDEAVSEEDVQHMPYLKAVVLEGLRKHPPGHLVLPHRASQDIQLGSRYLIPKGATVNFMVAEMGRDPQGWDRPMDFVPERFLPGGDAHGVDVTGNREIRMMPFGAGRRICAGLGVAMLHLEYFVANMVKEFEWKEVQGHEVDFAEKREFTSVMKNPLRARLVPRRTSY